MRLKIKLDTTMRLPSLPNFLRIDSERDIAIPIQELSDEELQKIGEQWTRELINSARAKREKE